jgi:hypothetical protein
VREAQRLASSQIQQLTPFHGELSSSFATVLAAKNFLQNLNVGKTGCARGFDQALLTSEES